MNTEAKPLTGEELLEQIVSAGMDATDAIGVFDAPSDVAIVAAQKVLLDNDYYLSDTKMIEGNYYQQTFMKKDGSWPYHVTLRYMTDAIRVPMLTLMYHEGTDVRRFEDPQNRYLFGTGTSTAEMVLFRFKMEHTHRPCFWMPVFEGSPIASF